MNKVSVIQRLVEATRLLETARQACADIEKEDSENGIFAWPVLDAASNYLSAVIKSVEKEKEEEDLENARRMQLEAAVRESDKPT